MTVTLALFIISAAVIYLACGFFVNGVEWVGRKFNVSQTASGAASPAA